MKSFYRYLWRLVQTPLVKEAVVVVIPLLHVDKEIHFLFKTNIAPPSPLSVFPSRHPITWAILVFLGCCSACFRTSSFMKRAGSAESSRDVRLLPAIAADELRVLLQGADFLGFSGLGKFADMELVVIRVAAEIIDVDKSSGHFFPFSYNVSVV